MKSFVCAVALMGCVGSVQAEIVKLSWKGTVEQTVSDQIPVSKGDSVEGYLVLDTSIEPGRIDFPSQGGCSGIYASAVAESYVAMGNYEETFHKASHLSTGATSHSVKDSFKTDIYSDWYSDYRDVLPNYSIGEYFMGYGAIAADLLSSDKKCDIKNFSTNPEVFNYPNGHHLANKTSFIDFYVKTGETAARGEQTVSFVINSMEVTSVDPDPCADCVSPVEQELKDIEDSLKAIAIQQDLMKNELSSVQNKVSSIREKTKQ